MKKLIAIFSAFAVSAQILSFAQDMEIKGKNLENIEAACPKRAAAAPRKPRKILVFSRTCGYRHKQGIPAAKLALSNMGEKLGVWSAKISEDLSDLSPESLAQYDCLVLNNTTGMCFGEPQQKMSKLPPAERAAVQKRSDEICKNVIEYVRNGGGIFAIHAAVDSYNYNAFRNRAYTDMLGGEFVAHPWYFSNAPVTLVIDDAQSPLVRGIWDGEAFKLREEIYMLGKSYARSKCRVILRLDKSRSPLTTAARETRFAFRSDNDFAAAYVKTFGKGRIAYTTIGHADNNYYNPKVQEFFLRLAQFACGDLKADTSSIPFTGKSVLAPMSEKPAPAQIAKLADLKFGQPRDEEINGILFGVYANNFDKKYCAEIENFAVSELSAAKGSSEYRAFLGELLDASGISSDKNLRVLEKLASDGGTPEQVRNKLSAALDCRRGERVAKNSEAKFAVPASLPESAAERCRLFKFLSKNPDAKIPQYLNFGNLDETGRAMLAYALLERGERAAEALAFEPKSEAFAVAFAAVFSREGKTSDTEKVLAASEYVSAQMRPAMIGYAVSAKNADVADALMLLAAKADTPARSAFLVGALAKFDLSQFVPKLFAGFDAAAAETKLSALKTAETIATPEVFSTVAKLLPTLDAKLGRAAVKVLLKCSSADFTPQMLSETVAAYGECKPAVKRNLVRFAAFDSSENAVDFMKRAFTDGFRSETVKTFGQWKNQSAFAPLVAIAKTAKTDGAKSGARTAILTLAARCGLDDATIAYMLSQPLSDAEKASLAESAVKFPSPDTAEPLERAGMPAEAAKIRAAVKNAKTKYLACRGAQNFKYALDGDPKTRFTTGSTISAGDWIAFDFGFPKRVSAVSFNLGASARDFPDEFSVFAGASDAALSKAAVEISRSKNAVVVKFPAGFKARYVKFVAEKAKPFYWSIHELKID